MLFALSSLPCSSKAASSAPKINQKSQAKRCFAVFSRLYFPRQEKSRRQYLLYYQGIFRGIGKCRCLKTCLGSRHLSQQSVSELHRFSIRSRTFTAGRGSHPALKTLYRTAHRIPQGTYLVKVTVVCYNTIIPGVKRRPPEFQLRAASPWSAPAWCRWRQYW